MDVSPRAPGFRFGTEQVTRCAQPHFRLLSQSSGRLDYIETISQWNARLDARSVRRTLLKLTLVRRWLTSADFRLAFTSGVNANQVCFERELLDHYRFVFEHAPANSTIAAEEHATTSPTHQTRAHTTAKT